MKSLNKSEGNLKSKEKEISSFDENRIMRSAVPRLFKVSKTEPSIPLLAAASVSFSMVRHPFERLVSAYQDKVMGGTWRSNHWAGKLLKRKYKNTSFPAFVQMIVDTAKKMCRSPGRQPCRLNVHWRPFVSRCAFCSTPYTVIAKAETSLEDIRYIGFLTNVTFEEKVKMNLSGDEEKKRLTEERSRKTEDTRRKGEPSLPSALASHYFSQVSKKQLEALYSVYRLDFKMFGYSHESYMKVAIA